MEYLEMNNVLARCQSGFRRGTSCSLNFLLFYSSCCCFIQGSWMLYRRGMDAVYLENREVWRAITGMDAGITLMRDK